MYYYWSKNNHARPCRTKTSVPNQATINPLNRCKMARNLSSWQHKMIVHMISSKNKLTTSQMAKLLTFTFYSWDADRLSSDQGPQNDHVEWKQKMSNAFGYRDREIFFLSGKFAILLLIPKFQMSSISSETKCAPYAYASTPSSYYASRTLELESPYLIFDEW